MFPLLVAWWSVYEERFLWEDDHSEVLCGHTISTVEDVECSGSGGYFQYVCGNSSVLWMLFSLMRITSAHIGGCSVLLIQFAHLFALIIINSSYHTYQLMLSTMQADHQYCIGKNC